MVTPWCFGTGFEFQGSRNGRRRLPQHDLRDHLRWSGVSGKVAPMIFNIEEATYLGGWPPAA